MISDINIVLLKGNIYLTITQNKHNSFVNLHCFLHLNRSGTHLVVYTKPYCLNRSLKANQPKGHKTK